MPGRRRRPRRRRGRNGSRSGMQRFQDTTLVTYTLNQPQGIDITVANGCYSLSARSVIPRALTVQIVPTLSNTALSGSVATNIAVQLQAVLNGDAVPGSGPFRVISNINPTTFRINFRRLGRTMPAVLRSYDAGSSSVYARINFFGQQLENPRALTIRTTYLWDVFPQEEVVAGPTASADGSFDLVNPLAGLHLDGSSHHHQ